MQGVECATKYSVLCSVPASTLHLLLQAFANQFPFLQASVIPRRFCKRSQSHTRSCKRSQSHAQSCKRRRPPTCCSCSCLLRLWGRAPSRPPSTWHHSAAPCGSCCCRRSPLGARPRTPGCPARQIRSTSEFSSLMYVAAVIAAAHAMPHPSAPHHA